MSDKKYASIKDENAAGRVDFEDGKAVWQWAQDQNDSTSILIQSLDNPDLALERTQTTPIPHNPGAKPGAKPAGKSAAPERAKRKGRDADEEDSGWQVDTRRGGGFDPYNRS